MTFTSSEAERVFNDGSYKSLTDEELRQLQLACVNVTGHNQVNVGRVRIVGEGLRAEIAERATRRQKIEASGVLSDSLEYGLTPALSPKARANPTVWDEAQLSKLVTDGVEECFNIEYKRAAALTREPRSKAEVTKDVSSMANSAGGVIIYGISETAAGHLPEMIDPVNRDAFSKEWLEHIISQIQPRIAEVRIIPVSLSSSPNDIAYVVEVPKGTTAHQAIDGRYYRRYNFESVSMLDHEIKDVMNRRSHAKVGAKAEFAVYPSRNSDGNDGVLAFSIQNESDVLARYVGLVVYAPTQFQARDIWYPEAHVTNDAEGESWRLGFSNHDSAPLFPRGNLVRLFPFRFVRALKVRQKEAKNFRYSLFADSMPRQEGTFTYDEIVSNRYAPKHPGETPQPV